MQRHLCCICPYRIREKTPNISCRFASPTSYEGNSISFVAACWVVIGSTQGEGFVSRHDHLEDGLWQLGAGEAGSEERPRERLQLEWFKSQQGDKAHSSLLACLQFFVMLCHGFLFVEPACWPVAHVLGKKPMWAAQAMLSNSCMLLPVHENRSVRSTGSEADVPSAYGEGWYHKRPELNGTRVDDMDHVRVHLPK